MNASTTTLAGLGGANQRAVAAVVSSGAAVLSVADVGTKESFLDAWTRRLADHARLLRTRGEGLAHPVVLVYVPDWARVGNELGWVRRPMLGSRVADSLSGTFGVGALNAGAYTKPMQVLDANDVEQTIAQAGLGRYLTIALMSTTELWIWMQGLDAGGQPFQKPLDDAPVALDLRKLDEKLWEFYERVARENSKWWHDSAQRITVSPPEAIVQHDLWLYLLGAYADRAKVKQEVNIGKGRADLVLTPDRDSDSSAVFELKVTRDCYTPQPGTTTLTKITLADNIVWVRSGVQQTRAYCETERLDGAFLCVYDFCAGNRQELETAVQDAAIQLNVMGRRYWITASHEEHRKDRFPLQLPTASAAPAENGKGGSAPLPTATEAPNAAPAPLRAPSSTKR
jgi:hypothetical protein